MLIENNMKGEIEISHPLFLFIGQITLWNYIKNLNHGIRGKKWGYKTKKQRKWKIEEGF